MNTNTRNKIEKIILNNAPIGVTKIAEMLSISKEMVHRHLKNLLKEEKVYKVGSPPKVYYFSVIKNTKNKLEISNKDKDFLAQNFIDFTPDGRMLQGIEGFNNWCQKRWFDTKKEINTYQKTLKKYFGFKDNNFLISWSVKMKQSFEKVYLDEIYYLDFYSIEKYWKTVLGNLMFYGKQTADKEIIAKILKIIKPTISDFIQKEKINSVAFIPPSIDRKIQILTEIKKGLNLNLKELKLLKIFKDKVVAQKSLNKKMDRIINARETIFLENRNLKAGKIILIDDAVGSGSTLNETAKKIKENKISDYVIWLAIVGSYKWFDVISEV